MDPTEFTSMIGTGSYWMVIKESPTWIAEMESFGRGDYSKCIQMSHNFLEKHKVSSGWGTVIQFKPHTDYAGKMSVIDINETKDPEILNLYRAVLKQLKIFATIDGHGRRR